MGTAERCCSNCRNCNLHGNGCNDDGENVCGDWEPNPGEPNLPPKPVMKGVGVTAKHKLKTEPKNNNCSPIDKIIEESTKIPMTIGDITVVTCILKHNKYCVVGSARGSYETAYPEAIKKIREKLTELEEYRKSWL